ncbi:MAG: hypothetical protein KC925_00995 [Candidatus Doudnabacteria bacterium]|nr:hypothetical protein [Candidatus Doudnabacteria bacterium]
MQTRTEAPNRTWQLQQLQEVLVAAYQHPIYRTAWEQQGYSGARIATSGLGDVPGTPYTPELGIRFSLPTSRREQTALQKQLLPLLLGPSHTRFTQLSIALFHGIDPYKTGATLTHLLQGRRRITRTYHPGADRAALVHQLNEQQPTLLIGYPSVIERLAQEQIAGRLSIVPKRVIVFEEPASNRTLRLSEAAWSVPTHYLLQCGSLPIAFSEEQTPDQLIPLQNCTISERTTNEFIPVAETAIGRLVVTSLLHLERPIVRLATNLLIREQELGTWQLPLGQPHEVLWFQTFAGGNTYLDPVSLGDIDAPGLKQFQYVRHGIRSLTMRAEFSGSPDATFPKIHKRIEVLLAERQLTGAVDFRIEPVEELPPDPNTGIFHRILHAS